MVRSSQERREQLVHCTVRAGWAKFGASPLDDATYEYITGVACSIMAEVEDPDAGEKELLEELSALLLQQDLKDKQVVSLCRAIARCVIPTKSSLAAEEPVQLREEVETCTDDQVLCRVNDVILMYMGSSKLLLKDTALELRRGHRYGIVGSNGTGKTTLMECIAAGAIAELARSRLRFVHIRHETLNERVDPETRSADFALGVVGADAPLEEAFREVGFTEELQSKSIRELSGGWRVRLLLATAVAQRADVLLLDEPTNHLDVAAVAWLVQYLREGLHKATALVVSHDAPFLDKICTDIIHFDECCLKYYAGNFTRFQVQAMLHEEEEVQALLRVRGRADEVRPVARSALGQADEASFQMHFPLPGKVEGLASTKKAVIEVKGACFRYPLAKEFALRHVNCRVHLGSRVAIIGPNGAGKSTLLSMLCGEVRPTEDAQGQLGEVVRHRSLRLAYIAQSQAFHLSEYARCTAAEYIQLRYRNGYDEELQKRLNSPGSKQEEAALNRLAARYGKYSKRVEAVVSRSKRKTEWRYEVKWQDLAEKQNTFESIAKLRQLGVERMATALDERLAGGQVGNDERSLTQREIARHFESFGLSEEAMTQQTIGTLSGGQKLKLMIGAAFWMKPHVVCLDEPTNFLDFETVAALAQALRRFRGGVVVVSHNEEFLAKVCTEIWSVQNHEVTVVKVDDQAPNDELEEMSR